MSEGRHSLVCLCISSAFSFASSTISAPEVHHTFDEILGGDIEQRLFHNKKMLHDACDTKHLRRRHDTWCLQPQAGRQIFWLGQRIRRGGRGGGVQGTGGSLLLWLSAFLVHPCVRATTQSSKCQQV